MTWVDHDQLVVVYVPEGRISCSFKDATPLAVGTLHSTETNNDVFDVPAPGAIAWKYQGKGTISNPTTGQRYQVTIGLGGFAPPGGVFEFDPDVVRLNALPVR